MKKQLYLTLMLLWMSHFLIDYMIGIWAVYKTIIGLDLAVAGFIAGFSALTGEGMQLVFGSLSDRGYRKFLIIGGLVATMASVFMAYTQEPVFLFLLFMITCLGSGAFHPAAGGLVSTLSKEKKGFFLAIFQSGGALGLATSQLIFTAIYENYHSQTGFLIVPSLLLVGFLFSYRLLETSGSRVLTGKKLDLKIFGNFFKHKYLRNLYFIQLTTQSLGWGTIFFLPDLLVYRGYPEWVSFGGAHFCYILGSAFMIVPGGYLADKYSSKNVLMITLIVSVILFYTLLCFPQLSPTALCALLFCLGSSQGLVSPLVLSTGTHLVPDRPGMVSAFLMGLVWCFAEGIGQCGGGLLTKLFTENATAMSLAILGTLSFVAIWATSRLSVKISDEEKYEFAV